MEPTIAASRGGIRELSVESAWLDGEIAHLDDNGFPDFEQLQRDMRARAEHRLVYHVFDLPWLNGVDLTGQRLLDRKQLLREGIAGSGPQIRFTDQIIGDGHDVFAQADALDLEGIVSKRSNSAYHPGVRSRDWQKVKCWRALTVVVGGVVFDREGHIESLLAGTPVEGGLRFEGIVEFGLSRIDHLRELLVELATTESPFIGEWRPNQRRFWLRPDVTVEIRSLPRRPGRLLRHATAVRRV